MVAVRLTAVPRKSVPPKLTVLPEWSEAPSRVSVPAADAVAITDSERGEPVGQRVGYAVRFESRTSDATRIVFVTEGLLVRRLRDEYRAKARK